MEKTFNESSDLFPIQSGQEGYTTEKKKQPAKTSGSWAFRARKTCFDLLLDSLQITRHICKDDAVTLLVGHKTRTLILAARGQYFVSWEGSSRQALSVPGLQVRATSLWFQP